MSQKAALIIDGSAGRGISWPFLTNFSKYIEGTTVACFLLTITLVVPLTMATQLAEPSLFTAQIGQEFAIDVFAALSE